MISSLPLNSCWMIAFCCSLHTSELCTNMHNWTVPTNSLQLRSWTKQTTLHPWESSQISFEFLTDCICSVRRPSWLYAQQFSLFPFEHPHYLKGCYSSCLISTSCSLSISCSSSSSYAASGSGLASGSCLLFTSCTRSSFCSLFAS